MLRTAIFRADASSAIGGGHVQRCLALGDALKREGWRCLFVCRPPTSATVPMLASSDHVVIELSGQPEDEVEEFATASHDGCELLVVDHYSLGEAFETAARSTARRILAIDDRPTRRHDCDFLLDPTLGRSKTDYQEYVPTHCHFLLGAEYALLRNQFAAARTAALARRRASQVPERLLVTLGTTDPSNMTLTVLEGVALYDHALAVDVVLGSRAPHRAAVETFAKNTQTQLHFDVDDMAGLMSAADIAVGACGSTMFERCCLGLPGVAIVTADNQRDLAAAFRATNASEIVEATNATAEWIADAIQRLCTDERRRMEMSRAGAALCDGLGAPRVTDCVSSQVAN